MGVIRLLNTGKHLQGLILTPILCIIRLVTIDGKSRLSPPVFKKVQAYQNQGELWSYQSDFKG